MSTSARGVGDWTNHSELAADLAAANKQQVLTGSAASAVESGLSQLPNWPQQQ